VFVADVFNARVLRFASVGALKSGAPAESVLGQPDFTTASFTIARSRFSDPIGLAVDSSRTLWVANSSNHRVLRFDNASSKSIGANADGVLGQADFTTRTAVTSQSKMSFPSDVVVDSAGNLWAADAGNHRVLRFNNAAAKADGANADAVLGQDDFVSKDTATTATGMNSTQSLALDGNGHPWVSDHGNNRILRYENAASSSTGAAADRVLGQATFTMDDVGTASSLLKAPYGISIDTSGDLWVADKLNNRVLRFAKVAEKGFGVAADTVLGQMDFVSSASSTTQSTMKAPKGGFSLGSEVFVSDAENNRILGFTKPSSASPISQVSKTLRLALLKKIKKAKKKLKNAKKKRQTAKLKGLKKKPKSF